MKKAKDKIKEFFATSWAIDNKTSIYVMIVLITILGIRSYISIPKEQFPEIIVPTVLVTTIYPGTSPVDIENLITRPIEKQLKSISGVKTVSSNSVQDFCSIVVEFNTNVGVADAKQKVKDALDKAKAQLPSDLPKDPDVMEIDFSEIPIMYIQVSGNYDLEKLRKYAEVAQDRIESLKEITRVDIAGALDREIQINADMYRMQAAGVTMSDIERAVASENRTISAGDISSYGMKRTIRVTGEFNSARDLDNIVLKSTTGAIVYLKDVAELKDGFKEQESFSRLNGENVITLNIIKRQGQNLIEASDKIKEEIAGLQANSYPEDLKVTITGDSSRYTKNTLEELNNTIIIGFILVILVLMFFMGFTNAFFVGLSVPLSMFIAYMIMPGIGFSMNMIVMFGFIFALGIVVDDAIVVIENTHRIHRDEPDIVKAAKSAAGEVFAPILSGTLTTLAPFFPLAFWPGIVGKFMYYMPVTLIITLFASLFVAYVINPVFAVSFMKHEYDHAAKVVKYNMRKLIRWGIIFGGMALASYVVGWTGIGNFMIFCFLMVLFYEFVLKYLIKGFQETFWPKIMSIYERSLRFVLRRNRPWAFFGGLVGLLILTFVIVGMAKPKVIFFPDNQPNTINVFVSMPVGTDQHITDSVTRVVEGKVLNAIGRNNPIVESVITNVAAGAGEGTFFDRSAMSNKGKIAINFVEYKFRKGELTNPYMTKIRDAVKNIPGAQISVQKNKMGPPTGKPVNIEISGEDIAPLVITSVKFKNFLDSLQIPGVDELKSDFVENKPEILIDVDRIRANHEGLSTGQIGMELRNAIYGKEVSKFKENEDEFPIMIRYSEQQRKNINQVMDMKITYRDMATGQVRQIPLSSVAKVDYTNTYGGINRKNFKRVITISSEVLPDYNANEIVTRIRKEAANFQKEKGIEIVLTGEDESQAESMGFLSTAMIIALGLIFFILITQFNSISKSLIILSEVIFSIIGVLLGIVIFGMDISVIMTGLGIVALGGIVVRNGILIVEFTDVLKAKGMKTREAIVQAGKTRTTPVILTATATILGLVPLAVGMNINFITMFTELNPHIHFGGDNVAFWGSLSWTIIFGLSFATFLTLMFVPAMYLIAYRMKVSLKRGRSNRQYRKNLKLAKA
jgi:multidrug efflux pump subunit AcrB